MTETVVILPDGIRTRYLGLPRQSARLAWCSFRRVQPAADDRVTEWEEGRREGAYRDSRTPLSSTLRLRAPASILSSSYFQVVAVVSKEDTDSMSSVNITFALHVEAHARSSKTLAPTYQTIRPQYESSAQIKPVGRM
jgi:hypothetical protein